MHAWPYRAQLLPLNMIDLFLAWSSMTYLRDVVLRANNIRNESWTVSFLKIANKREFGTMCCLHTAL